MASRRVAVTTTGAGVVELMQLCGGEYTLQLTVAYVEITSVMTTVDLAEVTDVDLIYSVVLVTAKTYHHGQAIGCHTSFGVCLLTIHGCS